MEIHQVEVDPSDRAKIAFLTQHGVYIYKVIPLGLCNASATFQYLIEDVLKSPIGFGVFIYIDNVLIYAKTIKQLIKILLAVHKLFVKAVLHLMYVNRHIVSEHLRPLRLGSLTDSVLSSFSEALFSPNALFLCCPNAPRARLAVDFYLNLAHVSRLTDSYNPRLGPSTSQHES